MSMAADVVDEIVLIKVGAGTVRGRLAYPAAGRPALAALLLGAHPLLGGDADNNVLRALREGLVSRGAAVLSFDYRGTGGSDAGGLNWERMIADFWRDSRVTEEFLWVDDARAARDWLRATVRSRLVLVGYSFGCRVLSELAASSEAQALVCVSPNPAQHDLSKLAETQIPLFVVSSDNDFSCAASVLESWYDAQRSPRQRLLMAGAEHFFRGRESELVYGVCAFLAECGLIGGVS